MEEQDLINFAARGKLIQENEKLDVLISGSYHTFGYAPIHCNIMPIKNGGEKVSLYPFNPKTTSEIIGNCEDGESIWIKEITEKSTFHLNGQTTWKGVAKLFIKGDLDEFDTSDGKIYFSAFIPTTPLAESGISYTQSYDGTIRFQNENHELKGIKWSTRLGEAELIDNYHYKKSKYEIDKATIQIRRSQINIEIRLQSTISFKSLTTELEDALDDTLWLISFLSRKRLAWYAGELVFLSNKNEHKHAKISRDVWLGYQDTYEHENRSFDLLISLALLKAGFLQNLINNYNVNQHKLTIKQSIIHLIMSYERGYFESHLGSVYAAIESLVDGLSGKDNNSESYIILPQLFTPMISQIKEIITKNVKDQSSAKLMVKNIEKINKTASKPQGFVEKLIDGLNNHHVNYKILWQPNADIKKELREVRKRRDSFIHQGKLENFNVYYSDFVLLRTLCELWILKLIDYPDDRLNQHAIRLLKLV